MTASVFRVTGTEMALIGTTASDDILQGMFFSSVLQLPVRNSAQDATAEYGAAHISNDDTRKGHRRIQTMPFVGVSSRRVRFPGRHSLQKHARALDRADLHTQLHTWNLTGDLIK